jgi:hypothetical protein
MMFLGLADSSEPPVAAVISLQPAEPSDHGGDAILAAIPWLISLLLHLGLVLVAIFIVWSAQQDMEEDEVIIPIARLSATPHAPLKMKATKMVTQKTRSNTRRSLTSRMKSKSQSALSGKVDTKSLALGAGAVLSKASPFDSGIKAGAELEAKFFGTSGNARRIVYLVDASGSLIDTLPFVILELKRSIGQLSERQKFSVIFFQGNEAIEVPPPGLKQATSANKQKIIRYIDIDSGKITPMGLSNPVKALRLALRYRPQLLFILSDNITGQGRYEVDQRRLLASIDRENKSATKINTIQFLYPDPLEKFHLKPTLQLIAERSEGIYKFLDGRELGIH